MTNNRSKRVDQRGEIEMPPLDYKMPAELGEQSVAAMPEPVQEAPESENDSVQFEESDDSASENQEIQAEPVIPQQKSPSKNASENFKSLREARERAEWERDTLKAQMAEMQRQMQQPYQPSQPKEVAPEVDYDEIPFDVADDALLEGKHAKQLVQELKKVKKELRQFHSQSNETAVEAKIKATYPDFIDVVSAENVAILNREYPEIAQTLRDTPDIYNKASAAYSIMKRFGIYKDKAYDEDKMKAVKNAQKPRPVASVSPQQGDSPLSKANAFANGLTDDLKKQMLKEMSEARRNM